VILFNSVCHDIFAKNLLSLFFQRYGNKLGEIINEACFGVNDRKALVFTNWQQYYENVESVSETKSLHQVASWLEILIVLTVLFVYQNHCLFMYILLDASVMLL